MRHLHRFLIAAILHAWFYFRWTYDRHSCLEQPILRRSNFLRSVKILDAHFSLVLSDLNIVDHIDTNDALRVILPRPLHHTINKARLPTRHPSIHLRMDHRSLILLYGLNRISADFTLSLLTPHSICKITACIMTCEWLFWVVPPRVSRCHRSLRVLADSSSLLVYVARVMDQSDVKTVAQRVHLVLVLTDQVLLISQSQVRLLMSVIETRCVRKLTTMMMAIDVIPLMTAKLPCLSCKAHFRLLMSSFTCHDQVHVSLLWILMLSWCRSVDAMMLRFLLVWSATSRACR